MKHYRILECKNTGTKQYKIQYLRKLFGGLYFWKNLDKNIFNRYEDALYQVRNILSKSDYDNEKYSYHYIDAHNIFNTKQKTSGGYSYSYRPNPQKNFKHSKSNRSVFIPKQ